MKNVIKIILVVGFLAGAIFVYFRFLYPGSSFESYWIQRYVDNELYETFKTMPVTDCGFWYSIDGRIANSNLSPERCLRRAFEQCAGGKLFWMEQTTSGSMFGILRVLGSTGTNQCIVQVQTLDFKDKTTPLYWGDSCSALSDYLPKTCR